MLLNIHCQMSNRLKIHVSLTDITLKFLKSRVLLQSSMSPHK